MALTKVMRSGYGYSYRQNRSVFACSCSLSLKSALYNDEPRISPDDIKPFSKMPGPKGVYDIPYLGALFLFKPFSKYTPHEIGSVIEEKAKIYGDIFRIRLGMGYVVYINHPDDAMTLFQMKYNVHKRSVFDINVVLAKRLNLAKGFFVVDGMEWAKLRKPVQENILRPAAVASYVPLIDDITNDLIRNIRQRPSTDDLLFDLYNHTTECVGMLCFNKRLGCLDSGPGGPPTIAVCMSHILHMMQKSFVMPIKFYKYFRTPFYKRYEKEAILFNNLVESEMKEQRKFLQNLENEGKLQEYLAKEPNFMYSLLADGRLTDDEIGTIVIDLMGAGIDSTSNTILFMLAMLSLHPDKQTKLYDEIQRIVGENRKLTKEHISKMSYLKACLRECHRVNFPILLGTVRLPEEDIAVRGYVVPKDTLVVINNRLMCQDERFFPRPKEFLPERWLRDTDEEFAKSKQYLFANKPFGFGLRSCIGQRFAETEIFIAIAKIIQNFHVSMPPEVTEIKTTQKIFTTAVDKVKMNFTERKTVS